MKPLSPVCACSLSLRLAHDIGYWDTWPDAIGEDMHMFIKAFLRTNGATQLHPIHAPINMTHVQGPTYLRSLWARFLQVREMVGSGGRRCFCSCRHWIGIEDGLSSVCLLQCSLYSAFDVQWHTLCTGQPASRKHVYAVFPPHTSCSVASAC